MLNIIENDLDVDQNTLGYRADHTINATAKFRNSKLGKIAAQFLRSKDMSLCLFCHPWVKKRPEKKWNYNEYCIKMI